MAKYKIEFEVDGFIGSIPLEIEQSCIPTLQIAAKKGVRDYVNGTYGENVGFSIINILPITP